jgi:hypothetical protein
MDNRLERRLLEAIPKESALDRLEHARNIIAEVKRAGKCRAKMKANDNAIRTQKKPR